MRRALYPFLLVLGLLAAPNASGQSTISDQPFEFTVSNGLWAALLPSYELGTSSNGGSAFRDNLDDVGYMGQLKAVRRFLGTRTSFEMKGFYAYAASDSKRDVANIDVPNPNTGAISSFGGVRTHLESDVNHYGFDIALRDTWRTRFGGLSAGCAFSYMGFDQDFDASYDNIGLLREKLDTDYRGGKVFVGWDGCLHHRPTNIDFAVGCYDMDADYEFIGQALSGSLASELSKTATTIETSYMTRTQIRGYQLGLALGVMYITDMPMIKHNDGARATLDTDDAVTLNGMIEILL